MGLTRRGFRNVPQNVYVCASHAFGDYRITGKQPRSSYSICQQIAGFRISVRPVFRWPLYEEDVIGALRAKPLTSEITQFVDSVLGSFHLCASQVSVVPLPPGRVLARGFTRAQGREGDR